MATFRWIPAPEFGTCIFCGTSVHDRGFVDMISETTIRRENHDIAGFVDVVACGSCLAQAARHVGCAQPDEVENFAHRELELVLENEKLKDEVQAWQQRFTAMANLSLADFNRLLALEEESRSDPPAGA